MGFNNLGKSRDWCRKVILKYLDLEEIRNRAQPHLRVLNQNNSID